MNLEERRERLVAYLELKVLERDWHGVSDAANDLRVLEAQIACQPTRLGECTDDARSRCQACTPNPITYRALQCELAAGHTGAHYHARFSW